MLKSSRKLLRALRGLKRSRGRRLPARRLRAEHLETRELLAIVFDLSELDVSDGYVLNSAVPQDRAGLSVSDAGDVNGDGYDDLLVGAPVDAGFPAGTGQAYLVYGKESGFAQSVNLFELTGSDGATLFGVNAEDHVGFSVSGAGDINGDGFHDYLIGAPAADRVEATGTLLDAGHAYAVFGGPAAPPAVVSGLTGANGFRLVGNAPFDRAGYSVGEVGDVNGDGFSDLIVGAPAAPVNFPFVEGIGQAYLVYGKSSGHSASQLLSLLDGDDGVQMIGINLSDRAGFSVSGVGDLNGDGFDDFAVGAPSADRAVAGGPLFGSGATYVVFGGFETSPTLAGLDGSDGFRLEGLRAFDRSGFEINSAGDINGDGFEDMVVSAPADLDFPVTAGETYVLFGKSGGFSATMNLGNLDGSDGFVIQGIAGLDHAGFSANSAGDVNGDGLDDLIIGAPFASKQVGEETQVGAGEAYVVFGRDTGFPARLVLGVLADSEGLVFQGDAAFDLTGYSVSSAGDVNGDGFDDMLIGAPSDFGNTFRPGRSYVIFGRDFTGASPLTGDSGDNTLVGDATGNAILGSTGDDALLGAGGADVLLGGQGDDLLSIADLLFERLDGGRGVDRVVLDATGVHLDLTAISDSRVTGIEEIDISGSGDNELTVTTGEILRLSDTSNRVVVRRNLGDVINIGTGWTETGTETIDGQLFRVFVAGAATLVVQNVPPQLDLNGPDAGGINFMATYSEDDPPVALAEAAVSLVDEDSITSARVTLTNPLDGDQESLSLTVPAGISAEYDAGSATWTLTGSATASVYSGVLASLTYENASQSPDETARVIEILVSDGLADSPVATTTVMVTAVNDAPVLDDSQSPVLSEIAEDATDSAGDLVSGIVIDESITDPDGSAIESVAIVAVDSSNGDWQYAIGGGEWANLGSPSDAAARLLGPGDRIRFVPVTDFNGSATIEFRAWDQTQAAAGDEVDTSVNGGTTAFSAETSAATIDVRPVNDAPVLDASFTPRLSTIQLDEVDSAGDTVSSILVNGSVSDPDGAAVEAIAVIASDDANGRWEFSADGTNWSRIAAADSASLLLPPSYRVRFVPNTGFLGEATLSFRAWDLTSGTAGNSLSTETNGGVTAFSAETDTIGVEVREVDNPPTLSPIPLPIILVPGTASQSVPLSGISDGGDSTEGLTLSANSSDPSVLADPIVSYVTPAATGSLTLNPVASAAGWSIVTVTVQETDGDEVSESFAVSVGENPFVWQNPFNKFDVNNDGFMAPNDVLFIINELNDPAFRDSTGRLPFPQPGNPPPFFDVSGDRFAAPNDALQLINFLNSGGGGEGEAGLEEARNAPAVGGLLVEPSDAQVGTSNHERAAAPNAAAVPLGPRARPVVENSVRLHDRSFEELATDSLPALDELLDELDIDELGRYLASGE